MPSPERTVRLERLLSWFSWTGCQRNRSILGWFLVPSFTWFSLRLSYDSGDFSCDCRRGWPEATWCRVRRENASFTSTAWLLVIRGVPTMVAHRPWSSDDRDRKEDVGSSWVPRILTWWSRRRWWALNSDRLICWTSVGLPAAMVAKLQEWADFHCGVKGHFWFFALLF